MNSTILILWLVVAGLLGGEYIAQKTERCGHVEVTNSDIATWLAWPVLAVVALKMDKSSIIEVGSCGEVNQ